MQNSSILTASSRVLVIGASGGIGKACAFAAGNICGLKNVTMLSRTADDLDITNEASVKSCLSALTGPFDLVLIATGGLDVGGHKPEKSLKQISRSAFETQFALNAIGPALILKHLTALLPQDAPCVVAVLSARVGSIGDNRLGGWISYRAAKAALNQIVKTAAIEYTRSHPASIIVALHPGTVRTALTHTYLGKHPSVDPAQAAENILSVLNGLALPQTGGFYDWQGKSVPW